MLELSIKSSKLRLFNEDCFEVLSGLEDESVDLAIVDSPYGINYSNLHNKNEEKWDTFSSEEYINFSVKWLREVHRILKPNGTCWSFFGRTMIREWIEIVDQSRFNNNLSNWITYARSKGRASSKKLKSLAEEIFHLTKTRDYIWNSEEYLRIVQAPYRSKGGDKRGWEYNDNGLPVRYTGLGNIIPIFTSLEKDNGGLDRKGTVLDIGSGQRLPLSGDIYNLQFPVVPSVLNTMEKQVHSAQKAVLILVMLIMLSSNEGDTVLDCFGGSFSTGIASVITNRNFIGIEKEVDTFNKGIEHIKNTPWDKWEDYIGKHLLSTEKGFKFGIDQNILKQKILKVH